MKGYYSNSPKSMFESPKFPKSPRQYELIRSKLSKYEQPQLIDTATSVNLKKNIQMLVVFQTMEIIRLNSIITNYHKQQPISQKKILRLQEYSKRSPQKKYQQDDVLKKQRIQFLIEKYHKQKKQRLQYEQDNKILTENKQRIEAELASMKKTIQQLKQKCTYYQDKINWFQNDSIRKRYHERQTKSKHKHEHRDTSKKKLNQIRQLENIIRDQQKEIDQLRKKKENHQLQLKEKLKEKQNQLTNLQKKVEKIEEQNLHKLKLKKNSSQYEQKNRDKIEQLNQEISNYKLKLRHHEDLQMQFQLKEHQIQEKEAKIHAIQNSIDTINKKLKQKENQFENFKLKSSQQIQESKLRINKLEIENQRLTKDIQTLETRNSSLEIENQNLVMAKANLLQEKSKLERFLTHKLQQMQKNQESTLKKQIQFLKEIIHSQISRFQNISTIILHQQENLKQLEFNIENKVNQINNSIQKNKSQLIHIKNQHIQQFQFRRHNINNLIFLRYHHYNQPPTARKTFNSALNPNIRYHIQSQHQAPICINNEIIKKNQQDQKSQVDYTISVSGVKQFINNPENNGQCFERKKQFLEEISSIQLNPIQQPPLSLHASQDSCPIPQL